MTCQSGPAQNGLSQSEVEQTVALEVAKAKADARRDFEQQKAGELATYTQTDGFASFSLKYPSNWTVTHAADKIEFSNPSASEWFSVQKNVFENGVTPKVTTTPWNGFEAYRSEATLSQTAATPYTMLELYPSGKKKNTYTILLTGDATHFDAIAASVSNLSVK
jgi:hypothetical protein